MNKKDKKLQKHLVDEMMKVYETNPNVMIYMESLMENYEKLEQENKQLKELKYKFFDYSGDEESFTLEDYLEISNELYDYEQENKQLKSILTELEKWLKEQGNNGIDEWGNHYTICGYKLNQLKEKYK